MYDQFEGVEVPELYLDGQYLHWENSWEDRSLVRKSAPITSQQVMETVYLQNIPLAG